MMAADYRHIGGRENRLGRHYSDFRRFSPPRPLQVNQLPCENCAMLGRIGEDRLTERTPAVQLRIRYEIIASRRRLFSWRDGVVPIALEGIALNVEGSHFGIGDFDTFWIEALVDVASDGEAGLGGSGADQLNDDVVADERLAAPVLGDVGKEAMLDAVPFAGAGRQMGNGYPETGFVGKALQFTFPEADAGAVAAAAIGPYGQASA